jgi:hypothetical protein
MLELSQILLECASSDDLPKACVHASRMGSYPPRAAHTLRLVGRRHADQISDRRLLQEGSLAGVGYAMRSDAATPHETIAFKLAEEREEHARLAASCRTADEGQGRGGDTEMRDVELKGRSIGLIRRYR